MTIQRRLDEQVAMPLTRSGVKREVTNRAQREDANREAKHSVQAILTACVGRVVRIAAMQRVLVTAHCAYYRNERHSNSLTVRP